MVSAVIIKPAESRTDTMFWERVWSDNVKHGRLVGAGGTRTLPLVQKIISGSKG